MNAGPVRATQCAHVAEILSSKTEALGVRVSPGSTLDFMISEVGWLGSFPPDAIQPDAAIQTNRQRALHAFLRFEQARRIAAALLWCADVEGIRTRSNALKDRLDRLEIQDGKAQDVLFELEIAGRCREQGIPIALREPDIIAFPDNPLETAIACKRPRSNKRLPDAVRKARHQIESQSAPGVIVLGMEAVWHRDEQSGRPVAFTTPTQEALKIEAQSYLAESKMTLLRNRVLSGLGDQVFGIILCGLFTGICDQPNAYVWSWAYDSLPNPRIEVGAEVVGALERAIFDPKSLYEQEGTPAADTP